MGSQTTRGRLTVHSLQLEGRQSEHGRRQRRVLALVRGGLDSYGPRRRGSFDKSTPSAGIHGLVIEYHFRTHHQGSKMNTRDASVRFSATPPACTLSGGGSFVIRDQVNAPALSEMRNTVTSGLFVKCWIVLSRAVGVMLPWSRTTLNPPSWSRRETRSLKERRTGLVRKVSSFALRDDAQHAGELREDERLERVVLRSELAELLDAGARVASAAAMIRGNQERTVPRFWSKCGPWTGRGDRGCPGDHRSCPARSPPGQGRSSCGGCTRGSAASARSPSPCTA